MKKKYIIACLCSAIIVLSMAGCTKSTDKEITSSTESSAAETTATDSNADPAVEEDDEIDPQLKADMEYCLDYANQYLKVYKALAEDPDNAKNDSELMEIAQYLGDNEEQFIATFNKLDETDKSKLNEAELEYYETQSEKFSEILSEAQEYKELVNEKNNSSSQAETTAADSDTVDPSFKETMDSYEAFFDEYVEFMKKYQESDNVVEMLNDYTEYLTKYTETMSNLEKIDENELSAADAAYYTEVMLRIEKKLLEVSASMY